MQKVDIPDLPQDLSKITNAVSARWQQGLPGQPACSAPGAGPAHAQGWPAPCLALLPCCAALTWLPGRAPSQLLEDPTASKTEVKRAEAAAAAAVAAASTPAPPAPAPAPELAPITPPAAAAATKSNGASPVEVSASSDARP